MASFTMPLRPYMTSQVHSVDEGQDLKEARRLLKQHRISCLAVTDGNSTLVGVISRTDLLRVGQMEAGGRPDAALLTLPQKRVSEVMTSDVVTVGPEDSISRAAGAMVDRRVHRVFVVEDGQLQGVLSTKDIMRVIREKRINQPIARLMSSPVFTTRAAESLSLATERLAKAKISGLVVLDDRWPVGLFTQREALSARHLPRETPVERVMNAAVLCLDPDTPLHRAAEQASALGARRILATRGQTLEGIITGIDLAQAAI